MKMGNYTDIELENFLHNIAWLRKKHGISKMKMAELLGIGVVSLNKIESGEFPPNLSAEVIFNLKVHFGISYDDLFSKKLGEIDD